MWPHAVTSPRDQVGEGGLHFTSSFASSQADVNSWRSDVMLRERVVPETLDVTSAASHENKLSSVMQ